MAIITSDESNIMSAFSGSSFNILSHISSDARLFPWAVYMSLMRTITLISEGESLSAACASFMAFSDLPIANRTFARWRRDSGSFGSDLTAAVAASNAPG